MTCWYSLETSFNEEIWNPYIDTIGYHLWEPAYRPIDADSDCKVLIKLSSSSSSFFGLKLSLHVFPCSISLQYATIIEGRYIDLYEFYLLSVAPKNKFGPIRPNVMTAWNLGSYLSYNTTGKTSREGQIDFWRAQWAHFVLSLEVALSVSLLPALISKIMEK